MRFEFRLVRKVPVVENAGECWFYDTGFPGVEMQLNDGVQEFFGIRGLRMRGVASLKRYTKFDYANSEIVTSDAPIPLAGGTTVPLEVRSNGWLVKMTVGGVEGLRYVDTGAAFSYMHNLSAQYPSAGVADECAFDGRPWTAPMRRVPCEFAGHPFEILCGDANDNPASVPSEGVIGYDFFNNFTVVIDRVGGNMTFKKNQTMTIADNPICPKLRVGRLARLAFTEYFLNHPDPEEIVRLQDGDYCHETFALSRTMPVLVPVSAIEQAPAGNRVGEAEFLQNHYWVRPVLEFDGVRYRVVNDWKEPPNPRDNRTPLEDWIRRMGLAL